MMYLLGDKKVYYQHIELEEYTDEEIAYHVMLLDEAELIEAANITTHDKVAWKPVRLTWDGHEYLQRLDAAIHLRELS